MAICLPYVVAKRLRLLPALQACAPIPNAAAFTEVDSASPDLYTEGCNDRSPATGNPS